MTPLHIIVARSRDGAIGRDGDLIWHLREDLRHFKDLTMGHAIVMGRRTWESLPKGALPGRTNIVVSRDPAFHAEGAHVFSSLEEALAAAREADPEPFIIGGGTVYAAALPLATHIHLTEVDTECPGADTFFPEPEPSQWQVVDTTEWHPGSPSGLRYRFVELARGQ